MNQQEIKIEEVSTTYDVKTTYHSDMKCENYDAKILCIEEANGRITVRPEDGDWHAFVFEHSDPDCAIAIAQMILSFAQMVKSNNQKAVDTEDNV